MVDQEKVKEALTSLLTEIAEQAKQDSLNGDSDIASVYNNHMYAAPIDSLDPIKIQEAIADIEKATATKEGARRLVNAVMLAAKVVAQVYFRPL